MMCVMEAGGSPLRPPSKLKVYRHPTAWFYVLHFAANNILISDFESPNKIVQ